MSAGLDRRGSFLRPSYVAPLFLSSIGALTHTGVQHHQQASVELATSSLVCFLGSTGLWRCVLCDAMGYQASQAPHRTPGGCQGAVRLWLCATRLATFPPFAPWARLLCRMFSRPHQSHFMFSTVKVVFVPWPSVWNALAHMALRGTFDFYGLPLVTHTNAL